MAKNNNLTDFVRDLADGFREKLGWETTDKINPQDFRDFVDHSPSVGNLTEGLETLNWTKRIESDQLSVECPASIPKSYYYDEATGTQLLPLIQFTIEALDPLTQDEYIWVEDATTYACIGTLTENKSEIRYILPVVAATETPNHYPKFPIFTITPNTISTGGVRVKMTAAFVQIGSSQYPMFLSGATMRGYK